MQALVFVILSARVVLAWPGRNVGFGAAGHDDLRRRIRVQANFAEYTPSALVLLDIAEMRGANFALPYVVCVARVIGPIAHAVGLSSAAATTRA